MNLSLQPSFLWIELILEKEGGTTAESEEEVTLASSGKLYPESSLTVDGV